MATQATYVKGDSIITVTASGTLASGDVVQLADGRAAVVGGLTGVVSGEKYEAIVEGQFLVASASGTTFSLGVPVYWDDSANLAVATQTGWYLGRASKAKVSGELTVLVDLNTDAKATALIVKSVGTLLFSDTAKNTLLTAAENVTGAYVYSFTGEVVATMAGASQDQMIVSLYDSDDNALAAMTVSDAGADAAGDLVSGVPSAVASATGAVFAKVPAGKGAYAKVSQACSGAGAAGSIRVSAVFQPVL